MPLSIEEIGRRLDAAFSNLRKSQDAIDDFNRHYALAREFFGYAPFVWLDFMAGDVEGTENSRAKSSCSERLKEEDYKHWWRNSKDVENVLTALIEDAAGWSTDYWGEVSTGTVYNAMPPPIRKALEDEIAKRLGLEETHNQVGYDS